MRGHVIADLLTASQADAATVASYLTTKSATLNVLAVLAAPVAVLLRGQWLARCDMTFLVKQDAQALFDDIKTQWSSTFAAQILAGSRVSIHDCPSPATAASAAG
jgi:hypothetical protein